MSAQGLQVIIGSFDPDDEDEANECCPADLCILFLKGGVDKFLKECFGGVEEVVEVLSLGHEEGVKAVDGFEFEVIIFVLLDGRF